MDPLLISAASGMAARSESLDMLANNIANSATPGFKADREFYNLFQSQLPLVESEWTDYSQSTLTPTGNPLNLGLSGPGFFALNSPGGVVYTRNGAFQISKSNELQTVEGYTLRNAQKQGKPIVVDPAQPIEIDKDGVVRQGGQVAGQIEIAGIGNPQAMLRKLGASYFALMDQIAPGKAAAATASTGTEVEQGTLEQSNVQTSDSAVRLVSVMRQFEMLQKAISVGTEMNKHALEEVARPS
jgi:flagellar basal body rod protein FlgG